MSGGYTPGWSDGATAFMERRTAESHGAAILRHLRPGMALLDVGCGPGSITVGLARAVAPGRVVGFDAAASQVDRARRRAADAGVGNVEFHAAPADALPVGDGTFDAAVAHALLEHLVDPVLALGEMRRALRPGGVAVAVSPDWGGFLLAPEDPAAARAVACYKAVQRSNGGDVHAGRRLGEWMRRAGFDEVGMSARYEVYDDRAAIAGYLAERLEGSGDREDDRARGGVGAEEARGLARDLRAWAERPGGMFAQAWVAAWGRAPGGGRRRA